MPVQMFSIRQNPFDKINWNDTRKVFEAKLLKMEKLVIVCRENVRASIAHLKKMKIREVTGDKSVGKFSDIN